MRNTIGFAAIVLVAAIAVPAGATGAQPLLRQKRRPRPSMHARS